MSKETSRRRSTLSSQREGRDGNDRAATHESPVKETAQYRNLLDHAAYRIYWVAFDDHLLYANPALAKILGYGSAEELLGLGTSQAFYCEPGVRDELHAGHLRSTRPHATAQWRRKDGKAITVLIHGRRVRHPERGDECVEVLVEDVTERAELEKQLVRSQKYEAIGELAGGIAHDFNNMIGAIIGWAELGIEETARGSRAPPFREGAPAGRTRGDSRAPVVGLRLQANPGAAQRGPQPDRP